MQKRKLGNLEVSTIGLGCMNTFQIQNFEFEIKTAGDRQEMISLIRSAVSQGACLNK